jgi:chromosome partitioning protein
MAHVISITQSKGGSTKTTTAINLSGTLKDYGYSVALIDCDKDKPDASRWAGKSNEIDFVFQVFDDKPLDKVNKIKKDHDFVIFDTPPNSQPLALKAIMMSDLVILPVSDSGIDQDNVKESCQTAIMANKPYMFLASKIKKNTKVSQGLLEGLKELETVFTTIISERTIMKECYSAGKYIGSYKSGSESHNEFKSLAKEVESYFKKRG